MSAQLDAGTDSYYSTVMPGDLNDTIKLSQFQPAVSVANGDSWWESIIKYGAVRAIDNRFGPTNVQGNVSPGTYVGADGRTYTQLPNATGRSSVLSTQQGTGQIAGINTSTLLLLAAAGVAAYLVLK